jgi:hypothetical protein
MNRSHIIPLYLVISAINGIVPFIIALLFQISLINALLIWGIATAGTFLLICLVCLRGAMKQANIETEEKQMGAELEKAPVYR